MVQIPRGALFDGALALSDGRTRGVVALAGFVASVRDGETAGDDSSAFVTGVEALADVVVAVVVPVVRGAGFADPADCTGAPRDAPAGVTLVVDDAAAA